MKAILVAALSLSLVACGGGSSAPAQDNRDSGTSAANNTAAQAQAAIKAIADKVPAPKVYSGAYVSVAGVSQGFVAAPSEAALVRGLADAVVADPVKYSVYYKEMLSVQGLKIVVFGDSIKDAQGNVVRGAASGLVLYAPDTIFLATLRSDGLHVGQTN